MKLILTLILGFLLNLTIQAQKLAEFSLQPHEVSGTLIATADLSKLSADLHKITLVKKENQESVAFQLSGQKIVWKVSEKEASQFLEYEIHHALHKTGTNDLHVKKEDGQLAIYQKDIKLLGYQMNIKDVPAGVNPAYARSGFIHPLNTPSGKCLTRIQPKDHYHHYGLWNPWTHVEYEGDTLDFYFK
jgi:hypothetical protein